MQIWLNGRINYVSFVFQMLADMWISIVKKKTDFIMDIVMCK